MSPMDVKVCVRFRPQNSKEEREGGINCIASIDERSFSLQDEKGASAFSFDRVFYEQNSQEEVYDLTARPVVEDVLCGFNGTIMAYGQTGAGKTHTMEGAVLTCIDKASGIIPRVVAQLFASKIPLQESSSSVTLTAVEIYLEKIRDLFDITKDNLSIKEDSSHFIDVSGATCIPVNSVEETLKLLEAAIVNRATGGTQMNAESSRSHSVYIFTVKLLQPTRSTTGRLFLVDLAGSEKVDKTGASGVLLEEAKMINKSLSTLGKVINALTSGAAAHVPYRESKLTRLLSNSLGGNSRTVLICCCSPSSENLNETMSTIRFGRRAKLIKNEAVVNELVDSDVLAKQLQECRAECAQLRKELADCKALLRAQGEQQIPTTPEYKNLQRALLGILAEDGIHLSPESLLDYKELQNALKGAIVEERKLTSTTRNERRMEALAADLERVILALSED